MVSRCALPLLLSGALFACAGTGTGSSSAAKGGPSSSGSGTRGTGSSALEGCPTPPPDLFDNALCVCGDYSDTGRGLITQVSVPGTFANVGVNGTSTVTGDSDVGGTFASFKGLGGAGVLHVKRDFVTTGNVQRAGQLTVDRDLVIGGDLLNAGQLDVGGTLRLAGAEHEVGPFTVAARGPYVAPAGPPCGCDPGSFFDVVKAVASAKVKNDNAKLSSQTLSNVGKAEVTLSTGTYYFDQVQFTGSAKISVQGAVALYVDGSLQLVGQDNFVVPAGSSLDLYVSGDVTTVGGTQLASNDNAGQLRLYVGGNSPVLVGVGNQHVSGLIYAPTASLKFVGDTDIHGAVFARTLDGVGRFSITYASVAMPGPDVCPVVDGGTPNPNPNPNPSLDAGVVVTVDAGTPPAPPADGGIACNGSGNYCSSNELHCCPGLSCSDGICR